MEKTVEKAWAEMTPQEKREARFATWLAAEGVEFRDAEAGATYRAAVTRLKDALDLKEPDRVPIYPIATFLIPDVYGVKPGEVMYDAEHLAATFSRFLVDYRPDYYFSPALVGSGKVLEILGYRQYRWPGDGLPAESGYQYVEDEYMLADEYEAFIDDPTDFWLRTYLPRMCSALEGLRLLPPFTDLWEIVLVSGHMVPFGIPDAQKALQALIDAGSEAMVWIQHIGGFEAEAKAMGFVSGAGGISKAPFDLLADTLRGTRAMMTDMYRRPETVLRAIERMTPLAIKQGVSGASAFGNPVVFMPLHKGADGFMSDEQFRTFYWPSLKKVIVALIDEGCVPLLFCEGSYNTRLEYLQELPKGSFWIFDRTDLFRVKELLGETICIGGNVPSGMILTGTAEQVRAYCKELIDVVGKGGGYVMAWGTGMDQGKADTVHAMIDFTKEYGVYA